MKNKIEVEMTVKYLVGKIREADAEILDIQEQLTGMRGRRETLHTVYMEAKADLDAQAAPDRSVVEELPPPPASRKRRRRGGRQQDPHTKKILDAMERFMLDAGEPVGRKAILAMLKETDGIYFSALDPMRTVSGHLSNHDQFVNTHPGKGLWTLRELVDNPIPKEEPPSDVVQLNVYQQETNKGRNNA